MDHCGCLPTYLGMEVDNGRDQRYQSSARANLQAGQAVEVGVRRIVL